MGDRLDQGSGLSGECIRTQQICRSDDAQADPRADVEASRRLGVRSVMVLPLLRNAHLVGVMEVFSSRPAAFGERDEHTLRALARRVLKNLERAAEPIPAPVAAPAILERDGERVHSDGLDSLGPCATAAPPFVPQPPAFQPSVGQASAEETFAEAVIETTRWRSFDFLTWALGATVLACAILLGVLVGKHLVWQRAAAGGRGVRTAATGSVPTGNAVAGSSDPTALIVPSAANSAATVASSSGTKASTSNSKRTAPDSLPPGSLRVYEKGKEVFRLPASENTAEPSATREAGVERASAVEPEPVTELSAAAAEDSLVRRVEPNYPEQAREQQIEGPVVLEVHIGQDGEVQEINLVSGPAILAQAATDAVKRWRFKPRTVDGREVEMQTNITLNFRLPHH
jgi:TonB family protein